MRYPLISRRLIVACLTGYDVAAFCMSQLDEKRRLLYWKFCRTIRAKHGLTRVCCALIVYSHKN
ncbi:hypothetical protein DBP88_15755 [Enterobacter hormaechei]|uniref:Uncharacterized protein n=1 Tax=Enterobacter hormaechei TaxID=158836 RepID=A0A855VJ85_9ENTR|nr:hypothetical protein AM429_17045 [Enterobacter cloacae complex sp.]AVU20455.1 hypothetical protein AO413_12960 [Enterobacter cloacae]AVZ14789.1 hypothetical protein DBP88_15755 [Enterobacter hormaechei]MCA2403579.1 hypothetical protein [Enterobacter sp. CCUG 70166]OWP94430.1 hypothetical protein B7457_08345 [Enterobacter hormaechei subsp. hoffmannii]POU06054.1 hypothetical protein C3376_10460 [Enterobacter cloacae complex sp. ECNIH17]POV30244.1 hypothetical protein C3386_06515 [Enterobacte